ncbi:L-rhamnose mutarotase [Tolumonas osonensis]|uniref:L-rhamnose mutarotase n=1 Tax=Tolumonas osonensis TaxID=675874 RepID=A0A841GF50_9GAMM|nr:L-rhamnose mutarotase [Tolumonas osonensis]MBB6056197.1 L-rhamnose mutarotase [Tolumonas osonensis]
MIRKAFLMSVNPNAHAEYKKRHDEIWPELADTLKKHGAHNYNIFLNPETSQLFAYVEIESEERWNAVANTEICKEWWAYMKDIMPSNPDNSPVSLELTSVFYLA